jgi:CO/xanthine dehydrogenase Mo-binding subunit
LTGRAQHIDDLAFPGMLHVAFLRSPHGHARIRSVDVSAARELPGVEYVLTGEELQQHANPLSGLIKGYAGFPIAVDKVRYAGEAVAAVAATSRHVAEDATERIEVDYEVLPTVARPEDALQAEAPRLYEDQESNVVFKRTYTYGDPDGALSRSDAIIRGEYRFPRVSGNPMETGGTIARWDPVANELVSWSNTQTLQGGMALGAAFRSPPRAVRILAQPHGGSFGTKLTLRKYFVVTALLSRLCGGRHVKYIEDRIEHLMASGTHAWDRRYQVEFGFARDGRCKAMRFRCLNDIGASVENMAPSMCWKPIVCLTGPYRVADVEYDLTAVATNKSPEGAYRGYGVTPHTLVMERIMDKAAATLGLDPAEIRRRNFIQPHEFPYKTPAGTDYDSGNYPEVLRVALERSGYEELRREQQRLRDDGRLVGLSVVFGLEPGGHWAMTGPYRDWAGPAVAPESATIRVDAAGRFQVEVYYALEGQGQFTFATQVVADYFGVPMEAVSVATSEARTPPPAAGPAGSRQAVVLTFALLGAADRLRDKLIRAASRVVEAPEDKLELREGAIRVQGAEEPSLPLGQVAAIMMYRPDLLPPDIDGNPEVTYSWHADRPIDAEGSPYLTYANACHVVMLEIDPGTGQVAIRKYLIADDCGTRLNPAIVEGQVQGGVAQGIGAALLEEYVYDEHSQPLAATFMDYLLPTVYEVPMVEKHAVVTPSPYTPLGVKGTGEGAIHVTPAAVFCAINDALAPLGVELTHANAKPERVWQLLQEAERGPAAG